MGDEIAKEGDVCKECPECKEVLTPQNQLWQYRIATKKFPTCIPFSNFSQAVFSHCYF